MDETIRALQRAAETGSEEAQKRYIRALERLAGVRAGEQETVYEAQNKGWFPKHPSQDFPADSRIYGQGLEAMLNIHFKNLGDLGFTLQGFPKESWDWLLGSLTSQVQKLVDKAYEKGRADTQIHLQKCLGLR